MSSMKSLFCWLCVIASAFGETPVVREEVIAQNEIKCKAEELCTTVTALKGDVTTIASKIDKQANDLKELKDVVINTINPKLDTHTAALTEIMAELRLIATKFDKSEIERRMQAEDFKVIVRELEEQDEAEKLQTETIKALDVSINDQSKVLENLTLLTSTVSNRLQKHSEELLNHDNNLKAHGQLQKTQHENLTLLTSTVSNRLQKHSEELLNHDNNLKAHGQLQKTEHEDIYGALTKPIDCRHILDRGYTASGVYHVYPGGLHRADVYCDMTTPGGPWLVFQRRKDGSVNFERTWKEYSDGFGLPTGEFWLGNEKLYLLTDKRKYKLRIELEDFEKQRRYAEYSTFTIGSRTTNYRLSVSGYSGNAGDSLGCQNGMQFSTIDADHDTIGSSCAKTYRGAWWYASCHCCNLNGLYHKSPSAPYAIGVTWSRFRDQYYSLKAVEMKIALVK